MDKTNQSLPVLLLLIMTTTVVVVTAGGNGHFVQCRPTTACARHLCWTLFPLADCGGWSARPTADGSMVHRHSTAIYHLGYVSCVTARPEALDFHPQMRVVPSGSSCVICRQILTTGAKSSMPGSTHLTQVNPGRLIQAPLGGS